MMSIPRLVVSVALASATLAGCDNDISEQVKQKEEAEAKKEQSRQEALAASRRANAKDAELLKGLGAALEAQRANDGK